MSGLFCQIQKDLPGLFIRPAPAECFCMMVHAEALQDLRACELLESLAGREFVMECIEEDLGEPLTFKRFPKSDYYLIALRNRINREIAKRL